VARVALAGAVAEEAVAAEMLPSRSRSRSIGLSDPIVPPVLEIVLVLDLELELTMHHNRALEATQVLALAEVQRLGQSVAPAVELVAEQVPEHSRHTTATQPFVQLVAGQREPLVVEEQSRRKPGGGPYSQRPSVSR
jgi:hypothetical protein